MDDGHTVTSPHRHERVHSAEVDAPAESVYQLLADVTQWSRLFGPDISANVLERRAGHERLRIRMIKNGHETSWTARRTLNCLALRIGFEHEQPHPPIAAMSGEWSFKAIDAHRCRVVLRHRFAVIDDDAASVKRIEALVERSSTYELDAVRRHT